MNNEKVSKKRRFLKSINTQLSAATIGCMLVAFAVISGIFGASLKNASDEDSRRYIWLLCRENANNFDSGLKNIEAYLDLLAYHGKYYINDTNYNLKTRLYNLKTAAYKTAEYSVGAFAVYFHADPEEYDKSHNFYILCDNDDEAPQYLPPRDPINYTKETGDEAIWYYESANSGKACWVGPYEKQFVPEYEEKRVVAYTIPLYMYNGELLGVLGMEFSLKSIANTIHHISLYESGYVFLVSADGKIIDHPSYHYGAYLPDMQDVQWQLVKDLMENNTDDHLLSYELDGREYKMAAEPLQNGMVLIATVPTSEIEASLHTTMLECAIMFFVVMIITVFIIILIMRRHLRPIKELSEASEQIMAGNMDVEINYQGHNEVGVLAESFRNMAQKLSHRMQKYSNLAFTDAMTGVKNKASYEAAIQLLDDRISEGLTDFGVVVIDLNNLKRTNDGLGHEAGDRLIKNSAFIICKAFAHSPVYRIGGDEFVVILENDDFNNLEQCFAKAEEINRDMNSKLPANEQVSFAFGTAIFDPQKDISYHEVFRRADKLMYDNKRMMKMGRDK